MRRRLGVLAAAAAAAAAAAWRKARGAPASLSATALGHELRVAVAVLLWTALSSVSVALHQLLLDTEMLPVTLSVSQNFMCALCGAVVYTASRTHRRPLPDAVRRRMVPLAGAGALRGVMTYIGMGLTNVSFVLTVKALSPAVSAVVAFLVLGTRVAWPLVLALLSVVSGVALATSGDLSFDTLSLMLALSALCLSAVMNSYHKRAYDRDVADFLTYYMQHASWLFVVSVPMWLLLEARSFVQLLRSASSGHMANVWMYLFLDGVIYWAQTMVSHAMISWLSPVSYSITSSFKRVLLIVVGLVAHGRLFEVTTRQALGIALTGVSVAMYNWLATKSKHSRVLSADSSVLPMTAPLPPSASGTSAAGLAALPSSMTMSSASGLSSGPPSRSSPMLAPAVARSSAGTPTGSLSELALPDDRVPPGVVVEQHGSTAVLGAVPRAAGTAAGALVATSSSAHALADGAAAAAANAAALSSVVSATGRPASGPAAFSLPSAHHAPAYVVSATRAGMSAGVEAAPSAALRSS